MQKLVVSVIKVLYTHAPNGWRILSTDKGTCKGTVAWDVKHAERLELTGAWKVSARDGKNEFEFKTAIPHVPDDARALLTYAVEKTSGLGESKEQAIWDKYGESWREHTELDGIAGIGSATRFAWQTTLKEIETFAEQAKSIAYLLSHGCTINMANSAWDRWTNGTIPTVDANPYDLAQLPHYGFSHVDRIRKGFGIEDNDPRRIREAMVYSVKKDGDAGHTMSSVADVVTATKALVPFDDAAFGNAIKWLVDAGRLVMLTGEDEAYLALKGMHDAEVTIYERYA